MEKLEQIGRASEEMKLKFKLSWAGMILTLLFDSSFFFFFSGVSTLIQCSRVTNVLLKSCNSLDVHFI